MTGASSITGVGAGVARGVDFGLAVAAGLGVARGAGGGVERGGGNLIGSSVFSTGAAVGRGRGCGRTGSGVDFGAGAGSIDSRAFRKRSRLRCSSEETCALSTWLAEIAASNDKATAMWK